MRIKPVIVTSTLIVGVVATVSLSTARGASGLPAPSRATFPTVTWGLPVPCPPHCSTLPTFAGH